MTAPAAAPASGPILAPPPRPAPQPATDRFAFAAVLDSLPGAAAKAGASIAEEGARTSNGARQGEPPPGQPDGYPMPGDGAFLSSLPFALPSALATNERLAAAVDASSVAPASMTGARLESSRPSNASAAEPAKSAAARLIGERAFHFAPATFGVGPPTGGGLPTDAPSFAAAAGASESGALGRSLQGGSLTRDAAASALGADSASVSPAEAKPSASAAPSISQAPAPLAARAGGASANPPAGPIRSAQDPARAGRKSEAAASPSPARVAGPAGPSAKAEPSDKAADGGPPDPAASAGQSAAQASAFGAQPSAAAVSGPSFGSYDEPAAAADIAPRASAPAAGAASAAPPVKEIDVDLSPSGLEDVSMTLRLAGDRLSVVIRAASSQTIGSIEGARDAIADRLAAIGQPLDSLIVRQTGMNGDANTNGNAASADEGSTGGGRQSGQSAGGRGGANDPPQSRRGSARDLGF